MKGLTAHSFATSSKLGLHCICNFLSTFHISMNLGRNMRLAHTPPLSIQYAPGKAHLRGFFLKNFSPVPTLRLLLEQQSFITLLIVSPPKEPSQQLVHQFSPYTCQSVRRVFLPKERREAVRVRDATIPATPFRPRSRRAVPALGGARGVAQRSDPSFFSPHPFPPQTVKSKLGPSSGLAFNIPSSLLYPISAHFFPDVVLSAIPTRQSPTHSPAPAP